jgi:hypothetical protein
MPFLLGNALPRREEIPEVLFYGAPLGVVLALVGGIGLAFVNLVDGSSLGAGVRELVPLLRIVRASDLVPLVLGGAFASGFVLAHAACVAEREGGEP